MKDRYPDESKFFFYKDYIFRSKTEGIWGIIFDELNFPFEYEKETYQVEPNLYYRPDFWLPRQNVWVEIKYDYPEDDEIRKAVGLHKLTGKPVYIIRGIPKLDVFQGPFAQTYIEEVSSFTVYETNNSRCNPLKKKSVTQLLMEVLDLPLTSLDLSLTNLTEQQVFDVIRVQLNNALRKALDFVYPSVTVPKNMNRYTGKFND